MPWGSRGHCASEKPSGFASHSLRQLPGAGLRRLGEDGRQQMAGAGAVLHAGAGLGDDRAIERVAHPVAAADPRPVVAAARRLEARPHRQEILDRDRQLAFVGGLLQLREPRDDWLAHALDEPLVDGDADERGNDALRRRLHVREARCAAPLRVILDDELAAPADEQAVELRQRGRGAGGARKIWIARRWLRLKATGNRRQRRDGEDQGAEPLHRIFPGFMIPLGSSACLMALIVSTASPCSFAR